MTQPTPQSGFSLARPFCAKFELQCYTFVDVLIKGKEMKIFRPLVLVTSISVVLLAGCSVGTNSANNNTTPVSNLTDTVIAPSENPVVPEQMTVTPVNAPFNFGDEEKNRTPEQQRIIDLEMNRP